MAITFTLGTTAETNIVSQADISGSKSLTLEIKTLNDTVNSSTDISLYTYYWYFIDKPAGTSASIDNSAHVNDYQVSLNSIDTWGTYRLFVIAKQTADPGTHKSEENPLKAPETHFINVTVKSTNNDLEKPANFQRNWKDQYNKLVNIVIF